MLTDLDVLTLLQDAAHASRRTDALTTILDHLALASCVDEAATNVNQMLLDEFLVRMNFRRIGDWFGPDRIAAANEQLLVITLRYSDDDRWAYLAYGEYLQARLSAVFLNRDVLFIRRAEVAMARVESLRETTLVGTSLHVIGPKSRRRKSAPPSAW